eukprot:GHVH01006661.1.p1 GENE.GHVH01006661.1~~GHVH01006661.1.p1  ORF type:complete len:634 (+),score=116.98 GHVH01006661.1:2850-4751(+)
MPFDDRQQSRCQLQLNDVHYAHTHVLASLSQLVMVWHNISLGVVFKGISSSESPFIARVCFNDESLCHNIAEVCQEVLNQYVGRDYVWFICPPSVTSVVSDPEGAKIHSVEYSLRFGEFTEDVWTLLAFLVDLSTYLDGSAASKLNNKDAFEPLGRLSIGGASIVIFDEEFILCEVAQGLPVWVESMGSMSNRIWMKDGTIVLVPCERFPTAGEEHYPQMMAQLPSLMALQNDLINDLFMEKIDVTRRLLSADQFAPIDCDLISEDMRLIGRGSIEVPIIVPEDVARILSKLSSPKLDACVCRGDLLEYLDQYECGSKMESLRKKITGRYSFVRSTTNEAAIEEVENSVCVALRLSNLQWAKLCADKPRLPNLYSTSRWRLPQRWASCAPGTGEQLSGGSLAEFAERRGVLMNAMILGGTFCYLLELIEIEKDFLSGVDDNENGASLDAMAIPEVDIRWPMRGSTVVDEVGSQQVDAFLEQWRASGEVGAAEDNHPDGTNTSFMKGIMKGLEGVSDYEGIEAHTTAFPVDGNQVSDEEYEEEEDDDWQEDMKKVMELTGQALRGLVNEEDKSRGLFNDPEKEDIRKVADQTAELFAASQKEAGAAGMLHSAVNSIEELIRLQGELTDNVVTPK